MTFSYRVPESSVPGDAVVGVVGGAAAFPDEELGVVTAPNG
jgi:hypothetical protein